MNTLTWHHPIPAAVAHVSHAENSLNLFLEGFAVRDIASPLASFDDAAPTAAIVSAMEERQTEVAGIRAKGAMVGWLTREDALLGKARTFDPALVVDADASLNTVLQKLSPQSFVFVQTFGEVAGVVGMSDLEKAPMRMWLFGLVTITELRVTRMIDEACPADAWRQYLSAGRLQLAVDLQAHRRRRGQQPTLLECLQLADKGQIVARDARLRELTQFASRSSVEEFVSALQDLRNNLAHASDIAGDWEIIRELALNVHRIVLGPGARVDGGS
jgi:hypothetical protein